MAWAIVCTLLSPPIHAEPLRVAVALSEEGGAYREFNDTLRNLLARQNVVLSVMTATQSERDVDLIIAVGMKAATDFASPNSAAVFNTFVPKEGYAKLQQQFPKRTNPYSAIYLDQPIERQIELIRAALPNIHHLGILYSSPPNDLRRLRIKSTEQHLILHEQLVNAEVSLPVALQNILRDSEVILALPDSDVYNASTIRNILLASYRAKTPIIGFSSSFVRAGALCAVFSTPEQIATQTAHVIKQYADSHALPVASHSSEFEVLVNLQVTRSLELNIPSSSELHSQMGGGL